VNVAISLVRRLDLGLRAPDTVNIAIAQRCAATLVTFDEKMVRSARSLGMTVIN
jgi:predicted nucleic acid-binding protein